MLKCGAVCGAESCDPSELVPTDNSVLPYGKYNRGECQESASQSPTSPQPAGLVVLLTVKMVAPLAPKGNRTDEAVCRMLVRNRKVALASMHLKLVLKDLFFLML